MEDVDIALKVPSSRSCRSSVIVTNPLIASRTSSRLNLGKINRGSYHADESVDVMRILFVTWNVGNAEPLQAEISHWLPFQGGNFDLVVVGTQENVFDGDSSSESDSDIDDNTQKKAKTAQKSTITAHEQKARQSVARAMENNISRSNSFERFGALILSPQIDTGVHKWDTMCAESLGEEWDVLKHVSIRQMRLTVYAAKRNMHAIFNVRSAIAATGIGGVLANKGALVVSFRFGVTTFCFVSAHLAAHEHKLKQRNQNCHEILTEAKHVRAIADLDISEQFDHIFWIGDLNYRTDMSADLFHQNLNVPTKGVSKKDAHLAGWNRVINLIQSGNWSALLDVDQLRLSQSRGVGFVGFTEGDSLFEPTFKVERQRGTEYKKQRIPSYCDRVLWKSMPVGVGRVEQKLLRSVPQVSTSDHKPVIAAFDVEQSLLVERSLINFHSLEFTALSVKLLPTTKRHVRMYFKFFTNPPGLLRTKYHSETAAPKSLVTKEIAADGTFVWRLKKLPSLKIGTLTVKDLAKVNLIAALFDKQDFAADAIVGIALIPLTGDANVEIRDAALIDRMASSGTLNCTIRMQAKSGRKAVIVPGLGSPPPAVDVRSKSKMKGCEIQ